MKANHPARLAWACCLLLKGMTCWAHQDGGESETVVAPDVEVIGRHDNGVGSSDAASQGVIDAARLSSRPAARTGEVLELVPGMIVTQHSGSGKGNQYFLRGFNLDHGTDFAVTVDGMPVNMRTHAHGQGYADVNFLIPELTARIDYTKGPYFAEQGDFSSAGSAHFRLYDKLPGNLASLSLGTDRHLRALLAHDAELGTGNLISALEWTGYDGPWVNPEHLRKLNGVLRYSRRNAQDGFSVMAMAYRASWDATDQIPQRAVDSGALDRFGAVDASDGGQTARYSLSAHAHRGVGEGRVQADLYLLRYELDLWSNFTYFTDPVDGDQFQQVDRRTIYGANVVYELPATWGSTQLLNRLGLQWRRDDIGEVALNRTRARQFLANTRRDAVAQDSIGLFLESTAQWLPTLRTVAGMRADYYRFDVHSNLALNSGQIDAAAYSPKLGLVLGPWARTEVFLNFGYGFHSNDARGTAIRVDPADGVTPVQAVTPLVKTRGGELGLRSEILPEVQTSLALWRLELDSELLFVGDAGSTTASRPSRRQGIEWLIAWRPASWLLLDLDMDFSRSRFTGSGAGGDHIPGAIERSLKAGIQVDQLGRWSGALTLRHFGPRPLDQADSVRSSSTTLTNARISYELDRTWRTQLDILNLFDRKDNDIAYLYASQLPGEPASVDDIHFHPVEPRQLRLTLTARF